MGHLQRIQHTYKCDKPECMIESVVYDHARPDGWVNGNITFAISKGICKTGNYFYACSNSHALAAFDYVFNKAISEAGDE